MRHHGALRRPHRSAKAHAPTATSAGAAFSNALSYHVGRLSGYTLAGAICGLIGATLQAMLDLARIGTAPRIASGALLLLIALRMLSPWNLLRWLETLGAKFWRRLQPLTFSAGARSGSAHAIALGFLWGWLPCGLVYSMLLFAALSADAPLRQRGLVADIRRLDDLGLVTGARSCPLPLSRRANSCGSAEANRSG